MRSVMFRSWVPSPALVLTGLLFMVCGILAPLGVSAQETRRERTALQRALQYNNEVYQWFAEAQPPQDEFYRRLYLPVVEGNRADYERNLELMRRFRERAQDAANRRMDERAEEFARVARLFFDLAQANRQIVNAILDNETDQVKEGFETVQTIERQILEITGNRPRREWFTPDELRAAQRQARAERRDRGE